MAGGLRNCVFKCLINTLFFFLVFMSYNEVQQNKGIAVSSVLLHKHKIRVITEQNSTYSWIKG